MNEATEKAREKLREAGLLLEGEALDTLISDLRRIFLRPDGWNDPSHSNFNPDEYERSVIDYYNGDDSTWVWAGDTSGTPDESMPDAEARQLINAETLAMLPSCTLFDDEIE